MSRLAFDVNKFRAANKAVRENPDTFINVEPGTYNASLEEAKIGHSQAGNLQAVFKWKIDENDENWGGKFHYAYRGLKDEKGYEYFIRDLARLGVPTGEIDPDQIEEILEAVQGTKCKIQLKQNGEFLNTYILRVLESSFTMDSNGSPAEDKDEPPFQEPISNTDAPPKEERDVKLGDIVVVKVKDKDKGGYFYENCTVQAFLEDPPQLLCQSIKNKKDVFVVPPEDAELLTQESPGSNPLRQPSQPAKVEEVEEIEEIKEVDLEIGMNVKGKYKDQTIKGKIHALDEEKQIVKINMGGKAYPCPLDTIELVG